MRIEENVNKQSGRRRNITLTRCRREHIQEIQENIS